LQPECPDYYATLGVDPHATTAQIRTAYRFFAKQNHPDLNPATEDARIQQLNAAHEILGDPDSRRAYDRERNSAHQSKTTGRGRCNVSQNAYLRVEDFLRGSRLRESTPSRGT
jgi:curved DNA-binding protein CbpA